MTAARQILVLADDLTGAAEIAAIATEFGLRSRIYRGASLRDQALDWEGVLVIDTDSRSLSMADARDRILSIELPPHDLVYKKTDSLLRSHPAAETHRLMSRLAKPRPLLLPQNPSHGRIIRGGQYFIENVPLHQTSFQHDPEHPRRSSDIHELLAPFSVTLVNPNQPLGPAGLFVVSATTLEQVTCVARNLQPDTLAA